MKFENSWVKHRAQTHGLLIAVVRSDSMYPMLMKGEKVVLKSVKDIRIGDIVGYISSDGIPLIHRVVRLGNDLVQTMADANVRMDKAIPRSRIVGKLILIKIGERWKLYSPNFVTRMFDTYASFFSKAVVRFAGFGILVYIRRLAFCVRRVLCQMS